MVNDAPNPKMSALAAPAQVAHPYRDSTSGVATSWAPGVASIHIPYQKTLHSVDIPWSRERRMRRPSVSASRRLFTNHQSLLITLTAAWRAPEPRRSRPHVALGPGSRANISGAVNRYS